jgi:hypothetical protein
MAGNMHREKNASLTLFVLWLRLTAAELLITVFLNSSRWSVFPWWTCSIQPSRRSLQASSKSEVFSKRLFLSTRNPCFSTFHKPAVAEMKCEHLLRMVLSSYPMHVRRKWRFRVFANFSIASLFSARPLYKLCWCRYLQENGFKSSGHLPD